MTTHVNLNVDIILAWGSAMATITLYHINVHVCLLLYVELDNENNLSNNQDYIYVELDNENNLSNNQDYSSLKLARYTSTHMLV